MLWLFSCSFQLEQQHLFWSMYIHTTSSSSHTWSVSLSDIILLFMSSLRTQLKFALLCSRLFVQMVFSRFLVQWISNDFKVPCFLYSSMQIISKNNYNFYNFFYLDMMRFINHVNDLNFYDVDLSWLKVGCFFLWWRQ